MKYGLVLLMCSTSFVVAVPNTQTRAEQIRELIRGIADRDTPAHLKAEEERVAEEVLNPNRGPLDCVRCSDNGFTLVDGRSKSWRLNLEGDCFVLRRKRSVPTLDSSGWNFSKLRIVNGVFARPSDSQVKKLLELVLVKSKPGGYFNLSAEESEKRVKKANEWLGIVKSRIRNKRTKDLLLGTFGVAGTGVAIYGVYSLCTNWNAVLDKLKV